MRLAWPTSFEVVKEGSERLFYWVLDFYLWERAYEEWLSKYRITTEEL